MKYSIDPDLLKRFITGNSTPKESEEARKFLLDPEQGEALEKILDDQWEAFEAAPPTPSIANEWFEEFEDRKKRMVTNSAKRQRRWKKIPTWGYIAAAACAIPLLLLVLFQQSQQQDMAGVIFSDLTEVRTSIGEILEIRLPDGSSVVLGPKSSIRYPAQFDHTTREVTLEGEAFFDVAKNPRQPFIVHCGEVSTRVLGTSFKVEASPDAPLNVSVVTGKVEVARQREGDEGKVLAVLTPGKQVKYDFVEENAEVGDFNIQDISQWKEGRLLFRRVAFNEVIRSLERWYDVKITMENQAWRDKKIQLVVNGKEPVAEAMETIRQTTGLNFRIVDNKITIYE